MSAVVPPTPFDRLLNAFRALVRAELPTLTYLGVYEYAVQATDGTASTPSTTVDCTPTDSTIPLPDLTGVPIRLPYGVTPPLQALCYVEFANGDPTKPMVRGFVDPMTLLVFAGGKLPTGRQGDMTATTISTLVVTQIALGLVCTAPGSPPTVNPLVFPPPPTPPPVPCIAYGLVSTGNPQVKT